MTPLQIASFKAHARSPAYNRKLDQMIDLVTSIDPTTSYVSFSAGKDSAVIAHSCHKIHPDIPILMIDPGCPTHWTEPERERWVDYADKNGWNLRLFAWDKWGMSLDTDDIAEYQDRIHKDMFSQINDHAAANNLTTRIMGLRASESRNRRMLIGRRGNQYDYKSGGSAVLPVANWQTMDIWAYIAPNVLPWLDIYDVLGPSARNGLVGRSGEEYGRIEYLKHYFPDVWAWAKRNNIF